MPKKRQDLNPISGPLRQAILDSGLSNAAVAKEINAATSIITRFLNGTTRLRMDHADRLASYFELELRPVRRRKN